jgi:putative hydrolase of the HAD superfamily
VTRAFWLFDLTARRNASRAAFRGIDRAMTDYIVRELEVSATDADDAPPLLACTARRCSLTRHHGVRAAHFLHHTHLLPGLEQRVQGHPHDLAALQRLRGRKFILTNAPQAYAERVLGALGIARCFDGVIAIEGMRMFGQLRPKPDARMLRRLAVRLRVPAYRCTLVEDTLAHQKAARRVGMRTVWMQRWMRKAAAAQGVAERHAMRPAYVDRRVRSLCELPR